jgi:hypothetical protein
MAGTAQVYDQPAGVRLRLFATRREDGSEGQAIRPRPASFAGAVARGLPLGRVAGWICGGRVAEEERQFRQGLIEGVANAAHSLGMTRVAAR